MSTTALRAPMLAVSRDARAYFAPLDRAAGAPAIFDPSKNASFSVDSPPAPWISVGAIANFKRAATTAFEALHAGPKGAPTAQFRRRLEARVEFDFRDWGKLQMALAGGSQSMNVLASDANADPQPSGGSPQAPVAVLAGSTAQQLVLSAGALDAFREGDIVAVDLDYQQQTGYVGTGIAAAWVRDPLDVLHDPNYVRRVTFNCARVAAKSTTTLILAQPLLGGVPPQNASAQKVIAFLDREGGSFFQEWSALFVLEQESGARACFYYPRLQPAAPAAERSSELAAGEVWSLHAAFLALPHADRNDGEPVLCYRSFFPAPTAALY